MRQAGMKKLPWVHRRLRTVRHLSLRVRRISQDAEGVPHNRFRGAVRMDTYVLLEAKV